MNSHVLQKMRMVGPTRVFVNKDMEDKDVQDSEICYNFCKADRAQLSEEEMEAYRASCATLLDSTHIDSDEEVSTKKEKHLRLGSENLDDTLPYDPLHIE